MPPPPPRRNMPRGTMSASKEENVYIPNFISKRPFYAGDEGDNTDYLDHQRLQKKNEDTSWYDRGKKAGPAATKFRKGACENCGAMTHKARDCVERPRQKGAKWTGRDIQADELVQDVKMGWDAKRDRWNGYDPREYRAVVDDYNQMEEMRKEMRARQAEAEGRELEDGDHYAEESDMSKHQPTSTRQLRLREDTAKYLLNLDLESAKYDPKTRAIVDAGATNDKAAALFAEQGFLKQSGDAADFERAQRYAWEAQEKGATRASTCRRTPRRASDTKALPDEVRRMAVTESEQFVEYDEIGLVKGAPQRIARSKYREDVFPNNHSSVWGSWWSNFKWGYACCHSLIRNSYCTGEEGKAAWEAAERQRTGIGLIEAAPEDHGGHEEMDKEGRPQSPEAASPSKSKKRTAGEMTDAVTEAEMDEYRRKKTAVDDPMARYLGKDELVH
ncbi:pre-mRNA-splicing factor SLU7 [Magnaporthiopsis poae ATCC 64411]|uniref:Pre-mRNA-splicing factor SLU7 n=1 Tax=Magnaporthiopsis poae (strain ATCC 64411 / 73-15) TaxID=644358 RepID=A0A0C4ECS9_MAGP6|nr:pre-mRNA-splicing factor SLU7 [Magnaporthiopsis poae ATCC 64411]